MAASPKPMSAKPAKASQVTNSPRNATPSAIALAGRRNVTNRRFVAPAVAKIRK